ncbi:hypothetical protein RB594_000555 [Gaeumannomyces avenae]
MAADFIGAHMLVTLREPPTTLRGVVRDVKSGCSLTLSDVWSADGSTWLQSHLTVEAANVVNLVEIPTATPQLETPAADTRSTAASTSIDNQNADRPSVPASPATASRPAITPTKTTPSPQTQLPAPSIAPPTSTSPPGVPFRDPAIIAVGKPPPAVTAARPSARGNEGTKTAARQGTSVQVTTGTSATAKSMVGRAVKLALDTPRISVHGPDAVVSDVPPVDAEPTAHAPGKKKSRRPRANKGGRMATTQEYIETPQDTISGQAAAHGSKGWRQTPMLEDTSSFQPFNALRKGRGRKANALQHENGWASEDVTDVQELGEFDFEGGLAKFDKHTLFDQMRKDDQADDAHRLVSHNRQPRPKPGTSGGKNLHYSENVLDEPAASTSLKVELPHDFWNSEADTERPSVRDAGSRQSSRRGESKMPATRRSRSRKASTAAATITAPPRTGSSGVRTPTSGNRQRRGLAAVQGPPDSLASGGDRTQRPTGGVPAAPSLALVPSLRRIETVSALQMLNLELIAHNDVGLTEEMMTENAARGVAEVALTALADPAVRLRSGVSGGDIAAGAVVVLAGNNKSGIRAVAAARHLRNKGVNTLVCVVGMERGERDLLEGMQQQLRLLRNLGGRVYGKNELLDHVRKLSIPTLTIDTPRGALVPNPPAVTLIVDALLGLATPFDELRTGEQATVFELVEWANRNEAFVLALDVPTGIDPSTGNISIVDGNRLYVRPRYVAALGAPKKGLLESMSSGAAAEGDGTVAQAQAPDDFVSDWKLFIIDIGLGPAVWKKAGTKMRRGIDFGRSWVVEMRFLVGDTEPVA